ncbi:MAG: HK97 family phage prohead protease, partial [Bacteroidales bacterium]|nr:HK97 family phage prohead protease [Bacteroidales bacterium]
MIVSGFIPFNRKSHFYYDNEGPYREILDPSCMDHADLDNLKCIINHCDKSQSYLGSYPGDVQIQVKDIGIFYQVETKGYLWGKYLDESLKADIQYARLKGSSIRYYYIPELQVLGKNKQGTILTVKQILSLIDIGPCTDPAYPDSQTWIGTITDSKIHEVELKYYEPVNEY